jgi:hypothetical protein
MWRLDIDITAQVNSITVYGECRVALSTLAASCPMPPSPA